MDVTFLTCNFNPLVLNRVDNVDVALKMEQWAKRAAQASAAHSPHSSISCATFTLSTQYNYMLFSEHRGDLSQDTNGWNAH